MKNKALLNLLFLVYSFASFGQSYDTIDSLRSTFTIENNTLTTVAGEKHFRYPFESKLHFDLAYYMKDLKASDMVYKAYKNHILPIVVKMAEDGTSNAANETFTKALTDTCVLFGNPDYSESFISSLKHQNKYGEQWVEEYLKEIKEFICEANTSLYVKLKKKPSDVLRVVIVTTTISGGNHAVAESMAHHLGKNKGIQTFLIDVEDIAKEVDPFMLTTGVYTYDKTYSSIFQKTNDFTALRERKKLNREIQQYIPSTLLSKLKQKIASINPDLIISTRSYTSDDLALSSLGIPLRLFHPDFEICPSLTAYYRSVPESIRFWLPALNASMFKPLFKKHNKLEIYDERDNEETFLNKISQFLDVSAVDFKKQFEVIGYPCSNFFQIKDSGALAPLRKKWEIDEKEIPVFIVMGKHGTNLIKDILDQLLAAKTNLPLKYLFLCGKNNELVEELKAKIQLSETVGSRFVVHGLLKPDEMNEIMNLSALGISKAGGATVVESIMTRCPLMLMHSYPWEEVNAAYLTEIGLATRYDPSKELVRQIEDCISKNNTFEKSSEVEKWRELLNFYIEDFKRASQVSL